MFGDQEGMFFLVFQKRYGVHNVSLKPSFFRGFFDGVEGKDWTMTSMWHHGIWAMLEILDMTWFPNESWLAYDGILKTFMAYEIFPE